MCSRLMAPGVTLGERDRAFVLKKQAYYRIGSEYTPGPVVYDQLCRIARRAGIMRQRRPIGTKAATEIVQRARQEVAVPERFRVGARMPEPPPLRRPVVATGGSPTETWDPAGAPGL